MATDLRGGGLTSILRPSTSVPWSFSLARSASELDSNVTKPKPWQEKGELIFVPNFWKQHFIPPPRWPTLDPLSLKMISTSRILPNCWNDKKSSRGWGERGAGFKSHAHHRESALCNHDEMEPSQLQSSLTASLLLLFSLHRILDAFLLLNSTAQEQISL